MENDDDSAPFRTAHPSAPDSVQVFNACRDGKLNDLKTMLCNLNVEYRHTLIHSFTQGATPLVIACRNGHLCVVEYLIEDCNVDITQPGCVSFDGETIEGAPPLWCAAAAGYLEIVHFLVSKGADVNQTTLTNSTPLRAACFDGHIKIVKYLVSKKADIEIANRHGHTCLMIACFKGHLQIVKYLLTMGAKVNRTSIKGNTALHDSAESGSLEIMKLLLHNGANLMKDSYGITPLMAASVAGFRNIIDHLVSRRFVSRQEHVEALELLGSTYVDKKRDTIEACKVWRLALEERLRTPVLRKTIPQRRNPAYNDAVEVQDLEELESIVSDPDEVRMQSLLIRERILGPKHPDTTYFMRYRGALYADLGNFNRCISLWLYALEMQMSALEPLSAMTMSSFLSFAELFAFMLQDTSSDDHRLDLDMNDFAKDILYVMQHGLNEITRFQSSPPTERKIEWKEKEKEKAAKEEALPKMLSIMLHLMCLMNSIDSCSINKSWEEAGQGDEVSLLMQFRSLVYSLVKLDVRNNNRASLLHLACSDETTHIGRYPICAFPAVDVVQLLLMVDADPNSKDNSGNTCLHYITCLAKCGTALPRAHQTIIDMLIRNGAHVDICNDCHVTPIDSLQLLGQEAFEVMNYAKDTTLKCLAARVIVHKRIPFLGLMGPVLEQFISMH